MISTVAVMSAVRQGRMSIGSLANGSGLAVINSKVGDYWAIPGPTIVPPPPHPSLPMPKGYILTDRAVCYVIGSSDTFWLATAILPRPVYVSGWIYGANGGEVEIVFWDEGWHIEVVPATKLFGRECLISRCLTPSAGARWRDVKQYLGAFIQIVPRRQLVGPVGTAALAILDNLVPKGTTLPFKLPVPLIQDFLRDYGVSIPKVRKWLQKYGYISDTTEFIHYGTGANRKTQRAWVVVRVPVPN